MVRDLNGTKEPLLVIANPRAGRGSSGARTRELTLALQRAGLRFTLVSTSGPGHASELAAAATGVVVVVGGDGTVHEVVNGLVARDGLLGPLAVLPAGSGDDFAANAGFGRSAAQLAARLRAGATRPIDVGVAHVTCELGQLRRRFVNDAGIGFEAEVVRAAARTRWPRGQPLYLLATLRALRRQRVVDCTLAYDGPDGVQEENLPVLFASVCNGRRVGGGLCFAPDALLDDRHVDVLRVTASSRRATLSLLTKLVLRRHPRDARVRLTRCEAVTIQPTVGLPVTVDGEIIAAQATMVRAGVAQDRLLLVG